MKGLKVILIGLLLLPFSTMAQQQDSLYLGYEEYLEMVKAYHP